MARLVVGTLVALLVAPAASSAQKLKVEADQKYLVLEVIKLSTFEKELNDAAAEGFRLIISTTSDDGQRVQALMERSATRPDVFQYRLVATFSNKTGDREMNEAAAEGFRVIPHTAMVKKGFTIFNQNNVVLMEKPPVATAHFQYKTLTAVRTSTFHRELKGAVEEGWKVLDMLYGQILLERGVVATTADNK